ncbi:hypothetical protein QRX60_34680 [Amycolatopsis mongoliensis]|uniref:Uncharacterized protein n=1 Tax=Amycolatopsis mongoliensis TaxID=715475 RepID=A0A9Y2JID8_9PSEU|nr:hypothetical protein [Amycolatopsis sp. 4-36]WIX99170.1 hypothetical protein QRX60_34680 [Amycolatopsis sp. 4-36]
MSQFVNIFCRKVAGLSQEEFVNQVSEFWYGDEELAFSFSDDGDVDPSVRWSAVVITIPEIGRPVTVKWDVDRDAVSTLVDETLEELGDDAPTGVGKHLQAVRSVFGIEIFPETFEDDTWEFLDLMEAFLARHLDGIVVTDDGVYDQNLKPLVER